MQLNKDTQSNLKNSKKVQFSADLLKGALNQLEFLKEINAIRHILNNEDILKKAAFRYEKLWLPFLNSSDSGSIWVPPVDIEFIWHSHLLCPTEYHSDCMKLYGKLLSHSNLTQAERHKFREKTKVLWNKTYAESFDYFDLNSVNERQYAEYKSKIKYNLVEAAKRQLSFYYQVSLPHYRNKNYVKLALKRYKKFIYLFKLYPGEFLVPCYSIDLIWHTHQLEPASYTSDTTRILGRILSHDDSVNDRSSGSRLNTSFDKTCELWKTAYGQVYFFPGGMYRGTQITDLDQIHKLDLISDFQVKSVNIYEIVLNKLVDNEIHIELNNTDTFNLFNVKMNYLEKIKAWSNICLSERDQVISLGRLVNLGELPSSDIISSADTNLNLKRERVMLLSNQNGDYALVKGRFKTQSFGDNFTFSYYSLIDNSVKFKLEVKPNQRYLQFKFEHFQIKVDLKLATVRMELIDECLIKDNKLVISCLFTCLFSFMCLYLPLIENMSTDFFMFNMFRNGKTAQFENIDSRRKSLRPKCGCFW